LLEKKSPFKLNAENVALDFVNTLDDRYAPSGPRELLPGYADLLRFCRQASILTHTELGRLSALPKASQGRSLGSAIELRELLARIFYRLVEGRSPATEDRIALERWAAACARRRELRWEDGRLTWAWKALDADPDTPALLLAENALELITADPPARLHTCASGTCRWLFLDTSKNRTRRWCDMKTCGNRAKARRYSEAHRD
jgi:predicted RNA-binding Zn ribbon-like protein